jgi:hypothetical protein
MLNTNSSILTVNFRKEFVLQLGGGLGLGLEAGAIDILVTNA